MELHGLNKLTLLDVPRHLACTVFTGGCNFRCPFCQNAPLVLSPASCPTVSEEDFFSFLSLRKGTLEGVCVTGGEPTLRADLLPFLRRIKEAGYFVKLDTNGYEPDALERILSAGCVDMVAMDVKNSPARYAATVGLAPEAFDFERIRASVALLKSSDITLEFRTTVVKEFHDDESLSAIGRWLAGPSAYYLQAFVPSDAMLCQSPDALHAHPPEEMRRFVSLLRPFLPNTALRGIEE